MRRQALQGRYGQDLLLQQGQVESCVAYPFRDEREDDLHDAFLTGIVDCTVPRPGTRSVVQENVAGQFFRPRRLRDQVEQVQDTPPGQRLFQYIPGAQRLGDVSEVIAVVDHGPQADIIRAALLRDVFQVPALPSGRCIGVEDPFDQLRGTVSLREVMQQPGIVLSGGLPDDRIGEQFFGQVGYGLDDVFIRFHRIHCFECFKSLSCPRPSRRVLRQAALRS